ncbi:hypothetical protein [Streptomyces sp. NPDC014744]|uniref:hypothetical protein n=1 Tax=Streptomyces sp. NPDC014744 TaxID=3364903 RepID=UPI0036F9EFE5
MTGELRPERPSRRRHAGRAAAAPDSGALAGLLLIAVNAQGFGLVGVQTFTRVQDAAIAAEDTLPPGV